MYTIRFWNVANECIKVAGKYSRDFNTFEDAWKRANTLIISAHKAGAVEMDINCNVYAIIDD